MAEKSLKVMISIPPDLLARADAEAEARGMTRSAFIRDALHYRLAHKPDLKKRAKAMDELRRRFADVEVPQDQTIEEFIRAQRDDRLADL